MIYDQQHIVRFWQPYYLENAIMLKNARLEYPFAYGKFESSGGSLYLNGLNHMTAVELLICLNQLSAFSVKKWVDQGLFGKINLDWEKSFIASCKMNLRKKIQPNHELFGEIELKRTRKLRETLFFNFDYFFGENSFYGNVLSAVKL